MGALEPEGPPSQEQSASCRLRKNGRRGTGEQETRLQRDPDPRAARAWARRCIEASHLHKAFGDRVLIDDLSFDLPPNGIVGVIGPNGVGKSTLFKMIVGLEPLDGGTLDDGRDRED